MKVEIVSRKFVKPSTPTPENLRNYNISFMDELVISMNVVGIFYYQYTPFPERIKLDHLEQSLAHVLSKFYPFAGRYMKRDHTVYCNDQGAQFVQARAPDLELVNIIDRKSQVKAEELNNLLPCKVSEVDEETNHILSIQVTEFKCGGIAIGVSVSHRLADGCSLGIFVSSWSRFNNGRGDNSVDNVCPSFEGPILFPGKLLPLMDLGTTKERDVKGSCKIIARKFTFDRNAVSRMREKCVNLMRSKGELPYRPSRVQLVFGLVVESMKTTKQKQHHQSRDLLVTQAVNLRERTVPKLSKLHICGNMVLLASTKLSGNRARNMGFDDFVRVLGDDVRKIVEDCGKVAIYSDEGHEYMIRNFTSALDVPDDTDFIPLTDWSKFGFYDVDFGWGNPIWTSPYFELKNCVCLMSDREGGGIEAWVHLQESEMACFEQDELLRMFAS